MPLLRRSRFCSGVVLTHVFVIILAPCVPFAGLLSILTTIGLIVVCVIALTGPVYCNKIGEDGTLVRWTTANRIGAVIVLLSLIGSYGALLYWIFSRVNGE